MKTFALCQKPLDLLNAFEYINKNCIHKRNFVVILVGKHESVLATKKLCSSNKIKNIRIPSPDIYSGVVTYFISLKAPKIILFFVKAIMFPINFIWNNIVYQSILRKRRRKECNELIFDAWRTKMIYIPLFNAKKFVIIDGGYSAVPIKLAEAFSQGGSSMLVDKSLTMQKYHFPRYMSSYIKNKIKNKSEYFTSYIDGVGTSSMHPIQLNSYEYSKKLMSNKLINNIILVLGMPALRHIDAFVVRANSILKDAIYDKAHKIVYRFHPQDVNWAAINPNIRKRNEHELTKRGLEWQYPIYGIEFDFINSDAIPRIIVGYTSSAMVWLKAILPDSVNIVILDVKW